MAAESPSSSASASADSYIGSVISLTSKSEIRYEGVVVKINTVEASIGLTNVRSFGTEGRIKDGPQIPQTDKIYEYIMFRGSDIKDLRVKAMPPIQTTEPIYHDPAIIQSNYSQAASASRSFHTAGAGSSQDLSSHAPPMSTFQGSVPLYQSNVSSGSWVSSIPPPPSDMSSGSWASSIPPPPTNITGLTNPMYWQQSLLQPLPSLSIPSPHMQQSMQYPSINASLPTGACNLPALSPFPPPLLPPLGTSTLNLPSSSLSRHSSVVASASPTTLASNVGPPQVPPPPPPALSTSLLLVSPLKTLMSNVGPIQPLPPPPPPALTTSPLLVSPCSTTTVPTSVMPQKGGSTPSLVTVGQLLQPGPTIASSSSQSSQKAQKGYERSKLSLSEIPVPTLVESQAPILPLPSPHISKLNGTPSNTPHNNRVRHGRVGENGLNGAPSRTHHYNRGWQDRVSENRPGPTNASSSQSSQKAHKEHEGSQVSLSETPVPTLVESQGPILPLASPLVHKLNGAPSNTPHNNRWWHGRVRENESNGAPSRTSNNDRGRQESVRENQLNDAPPRTHHNNRGRQERVGQNRASKGVTGFTEDFDFVAMNKKFNKEELWCHLGKSNKAQEDGNGSPDETSKVEPVYVKDEFFDSLSSDAIDRGSSAKIKFSERMKLDAETFGESRHGGGRGLGRGGNSRGAHYPRSNGNNGRGRGQQT